MTDAQKAAFQSAVDGLGLPSGTVVTVSYTPTGAVETTFTAA